MQSAETERALAQLDRGLIEKTVRQLLELRTRNDMEAMLKLADPNIVYEIRGSRQVYPYFGSRRGIAEIRLMLERISTEFENLGSRVHRIMIDGNNVAVERTAKLKHRGTSAVADVDIVNFLTFDRGLVVLISELADTLAIERLINPPADARESDACERASEMPTSG